MLIPSQVRNSQPLKLELGGDGIVSFVNAYEGEGQEFFRGHLTAVGQSKPQGGARSSMSTPSPLQETASWMREPVRQGEEKDLRRSIEEYLSRRFDPEKVADPRDVDIVFEQLKCSGSLCVSQIAIETGLPLDRIFMSLRQLAAECAVEWRPDRSPAVGLRKILQGRNVTSLLRDRSALLRIWREWRDGLALRSNPVELIETAWSIMRVWKGNPLKIDSPKSV
jgi:hypothetical protein